MKKLIILTLLLTSCSPNPTLKVDDCAILNINGEKTIIRVLKVGSNSYQVEFNSVSGFRKFYYTAIVLFDEEIKKVDCFDKFDKKAD